MVPLLIAGSAAAYIMREPVKAKVVGERVLGRVVDLVEAGNSLRRNERVRLVFSGDAPGEAAYSFFDRAEERYIGLDGYTSEPHYFVPRREEEGAGLTFGPEVTGHLHRHRVFTIAPRGGEGTDVLCKVVRFVTSEPGTVEVRVPPPETPPKPPHPPQNPPSEGPVAPPTGQPPGGGVDGSGLLPEKPPEKPPEGSKPWWARGLVWALAAMAALVVAAAVALVTVPSLNAHLCAGFPGCTAPPPAPDPDGPALDAIAATGRARPCDALADLRRWRRGRQPNRGYDGRADALERTLGEGCEARRAAEAFAQAGECARSSPCDGTCFAEFRRRFPGERSGEIGRLEAEAARRCTSSRSNLDQNRAPPPPPPPPRSEAWLRCEALMAPRWDPASSGGRADAPRRPEAREALGVCATALGEAAAGERGTALFRLGRAQQIAGDRDTARQTLAEALRQGSKAAAHALGNLYYNSQPRQHALAAENYRIAAQAGIAESKAALAGLLAAGEGVPKNVAEARRLAREASDVGAGAGSRVLGQLVLDGEVAGGQPEACRWFRKAVDQGDGPSTPLVGSTC